MRGSRPIATISILALAEGPQWSLEPLLARGADAVDIPLLVLVWFALIDRLPRVLAIAAAILALRWGLGASSAGAVLVPLLGALLWVRLARSWIDPRDRSRRLAIVLGAVAVATWLHRLLWSVPWSGTFDAYATGLLLGTLAAALLYPILDLTPPLLRSADYPM